MARKPTAPTTAVAATAMPAAPVAMTTMETNAAAGQNLAATSNSAAGAMAGDDQTQNKVDANMDKAVKTAEEFVSFGQGNFEAMMKAGQIWVAGVQDIQKAVSATAQAQVEAALGTFKALSGVKSLKEAMDLQTSLARSSLETAVAETGKLTDASVKLAEQAMAPITARVTLAVEKFGRVA